MPRGKKKGQTKTKSPPLYRRGTRSSKKKQVTESSKDKNSSKKKSKTNGESTEKDERLALLSQMNKDPNVHREVFD